MNIIERATLLVHERERAQVLERAAEVATRLATTRSDELVAGEDVAWLVAANMLSSRINGAGPRVVTRVLDDGVRVADKVG